MTFQSQQFQTTTRRRGGHILSFTIQHTQLNEMGEPVDVDVTLRVDPLVDIVRLGAAFGSFGTVLDTLRDQETPIEARLAALDRELPRGRAHVRDALVPNDRPKWDEIADAIDIRTLSGIVRWLTQELSGLDPTQQASSSTGSVPTGEPSTGGVPPEASTPQPSPTPGP